VLRAVGALARSCGEMAFARGIVPAAAELIGAAPFDVKKAALFVVIDWIRDAPQAAAANILRSATIDAMCPVAAACEAKDIVYFLDTCAKLDAETVRAMADRQAFLELLEELADSDDDHIIEYVEELWAIVEDNEHDAPCSSALF
jgi:hypothetical protein